MRTAVTLLACAALSAAAPQPSKIFPQPYDQHDLPNGLRVITVPTDFPNLVSLYIVVSTGSRNEIEPGKSGFAHFFEHMMFRGTKAFPPDKYEAATKRAGASGNAFTSDDLTVYHMTFDKGDLDAMLGMEADRFQNLEYAESVFRTEALAVLGEYNKNSSSPIRKLYEVLRDKAYEKHTYKHTTMGFLADIKDMPNQFAYSKEFFARWYRPEYTTVLVVGDVKPDAVRAMAAKHWGNWKRGTYKSSIPAEPSQDGPRSAHIDWPDRTLPWVMMGFRSPAYSDTDKEWAALDIAGSLLLAPNSDLYQKLVIQEQKVDTLFGGMAEHADPYLFTATARVKNPADLDYVRDQLLGEISRLSETPVPAEKLERVKNNLRYSFANSLDSSDAIAVTLARFVALRRTPETINKLFDVYASLTPADVQSAARKWLIANNRTIVTLTGPGAAKPAAAPSGSGRTVLMPGKSPLVNFRLVFQTGAAHDPADKPGIAALTAAMLSEGGTRELSRQQILEKLFPMASTVRASVDKEMTVFEGSTHADNLKDYYALLRSMILDPGWRDEDLKRLKDDAVNYLRVTLRGNNDEELGKEVLYSEVFAGHPYAHHNLGTVSSIQKLTMDDIKAFYKANYTQASLTIGLAGGYPTGFESAVKKDFAALPQGKAANLVLPTPTAIKETSVTIVKKPTRSVAYSFGFPIEVRRGHPDYPALLVAQAYLGPHRNSGGRLYQRMRQTRGLNYGDYAYIEHFPNGMFQFEPDPNIARQQQIFQIWVRPVEVPTAHFALRLALFELERFVKRGLTDEEFQDARNFASKNVALLTRTKSAELGYAIDSAFYGIGSYDEYVRGALAKLTKDDVKRAVRKHLRSDRLAIVAVAEDAEALKDKLLTNSPSPMTYNSPKPDDIMEEDKAVSTMKLPLRPENVRIVDGSKVFE